MKIFNIIFVIAALVFVFALCAVTCYRGGKDLKVGLYGVEQVLNKKSPYDNPTDPNRPIFRYAPAFALLQYPFLLTSKMSGKMTLSFEFKDMLPSIFAWYWFAVLCVAISAATIYRLAPSLPDRARLFNLKLSILMAMPLIGYELANSQNKLVALAFILIAIYLFEKNRFFLSGLFFNLAITVYIPLLLFILYFVLRSRGRYILPFIASFLLIFIIIPSFVFGIKFNLFLLKDWSMRCLKPFFFTTSYTTYMELRPTSQSLPSALGRIFVVGFTTPYIYKIPPLAIHAIVRMASAAVVLLSSFAVWNNKEESCAGMGYVTFLMLGLIVPSYCILYTWSWLFVVFFILLNCLEYKTLSARRRTFIIVIIVVAFASSLSTTIMILNKLSVLFWGTMITWAAVISILIKSKKRNRPLNYA